MVDQGDEGWSTVLDAYRGPPSDGDRIRGSSATALYTSDTRVSRLLQFVLSSSTRVCLPTHTDLLGVQKAKRRTFASVFVCHTFFRPT